MPREQFQSCPASSMPMENTSGMDGMDGISMSNPPLSNHAGNAGTDWAWMGMDGIGVIPKQRLFFHWIAPSGANENQGYLLALGVDGRGRARLFEWLKCETSTVIAVTSDYLSACVFYIICEAMNAAYARCHHDCPIRTGAAAQQGSRLFKQVEVFSRKNYAVRESCPKDSWDKLTHLLQNMGTRKSKASHPIEIPRARRLLKNVEVQQALKAHPAVSWCERMDSGGVAFMARDFRDAIRE